MSVLFIILEKNVIIRVISKKYKEGGGILGRVILGTKGSKINTNIDVSSTSRAKKKLTKEDILYRLREKRSNKYMENLKKLDSGKGLQENVDKEKIISEIKQEFAELDELQPLLGIIAKCYLGEPYYVHSLDLTLSIVTHFKRKEQIPYPWSKGVNLALHGAYEYVEIYSKYVCAITHDGEAMVFENN